jgi:hypothetical protein
MIIRVVMIYLVLAPLLACLVNGILVYRYVRRSGSVPIPHAIKGFYLRRVQADRVSTSNRALAVVYGFVRSLLDLEVIVAAFFSLGILQHAQVYAIASSRYRFFAFLNDLMLVVPLVPMALISVLNWWFVYWLIDEWTGIQRERWRASAISAACSCLFLCIPIWWSISTRFG